MIILAINYLKIPDHAIRLNLLGLLDIQSINQVIDDNKSTDDQHSIYYIIA